MQQSLDDWSQVPASDYLADALMLSDQERETIQRLGAQLPSLVRDAHTHIADRSELAEYPAGLLRHVVSTYPAYSLADAARARAALWPRTRVQSLRMAHAVRGYDYRTINKSIELAVADGDDVFAAYGLPDDIDYTLWILESPHVRALKMYYAYRDPPFESLDEIFPSPVLTKAADLGIPIILHLPSALPRTTGAVLDLCARHPALKIVLAHIGGHGGQFYSPAVEGAFRNLADRPNIYVDTAFIYDESLVEAAIICLGQKRVVFGTDEPLSLIRAVPYTHPTLGPRLHAPRYHWATDDHAPSSVETSQPSLLHVLQVQAVLSAAKKVGEAAVEAVFRDNAVDLYDFSDP